MNLDLSGQIALVTGASRGIGQAIADELVKCGAKVIGTATSESGAKAIDERLKASGGAGAFRRSSMALAPLSEVAVPITLAPHFTNSSAIA